MGGGSARIRVPRPRRDAIGLQSGSCRSGSRFLRSFHPPRSRPSSLVWLASKHEAEGRERGRHGVQRWLHHQPRSRDKPCRSHSKCMTRSTSTWSRVGRKKIAPFPFVPLSETLQAIVRAGSPPLLPTPFPPAEGSPQRHVEDTHALSLSHRQPPKPHHRRWPRMGHAADPG